MVGTGKVSQQRGLSVLASPKLVEQVKGCSGRSGPAEVAISFPTTNLSAFGTSRWSRSDRLRRPALPISRVAPRFGDACPARSSHAPSSLRPSPLRGMPFERAYARRPCVNPGLRLRTSGYTGRWPSCVRASATFLSSERGYGTTALTRSGGDPITMTRSVARVTAV